MERRQEGEERKRQRRWWNSFPTKSPWIYAGGEEIKRKERKNIKGKEKKRFVTNLATKG